MHATERNYKYKGNSGNRNSETLLVEFKQDAQPLHPGYKPDNVHAQSNSSRL